MKTTLAFLVSVLAAWVQAASVQSGDFLYEINADSNTVTIVGYTGTYGAVEIPSELDKKEVTSLGNNLFNHRPLLSSIILPETLTTIGDYAFVSCVGLSNVVIPSRVISIGDHAFANCNTMSSLTFAGTNVTSIGGAAFMSCSRLACVNLPEGVRVISSNLFGNCYNLSSIQIGRNVTSIGDYAFGACCLTTIELPETLLSIGERAFAYNRFTSVRIPNRVTTIGASAFYHCWQLTSVTIGRNVAVIGDNAFDYCGWLTEVYFKGNAPALGNNVFFCSNLNVFYLSETGGWGASLGNRTTVLWNPSIRLCNAHFDEQTNGFVLTISESSAGQFVVTSCTNLAQEVWQPLLTQRMQGSTVTFTDPDASLYRSRFYRIEMP